MISRQLKNLALVTFILVIFSAPAVFAVPTGPIIGKVTLVLGQVSGQDQDGDTVVVERCTDLYAGYTLDTAARSFLGAELNDGTKMTVSQNGSATLDEFSFNDVGGGQFNATVAQGGFSYESGRLGRFGTSRVHSSISTLSGVIGGSRGYVDPDA